MQATTFLDDVLIHDRTKVRDTSGGWVDGWVPRARPVPGRFGRLTDAEAEILGASVVGEAVAALMLPLGTPIKEGDRVTNPVQPQRFWTVTGDLTPPSEMALSVRLSIREVA